MVNIFGITNSEGKPGPSGPPGQGGLKEMIRWFPQMVVEHIRSDLNTLTLLIQTLPPEKDADVELSAQKIVNRWNLYKRSDGYLHPVDNGGALQRVSLELDLLKRYGLVFDKSKDIMYEMQGVKAPFLSTPSNILLTLTFLVGVYDESHDEENEEFIISDYRWSSFSKSSEKFRGVSIVSKPGEKFDLYLHGVQDVDGNRQMKFGKDLERNLHYTLQVYWMKSNTGFASLHCDGEIVIQETSFQHGTPPDITRPGFYLGGFNASTSYKSDVVKSKCFTGIISNVEIINTRNLIIPRELLDLIWEVQTVYNDWSKIKTADDVRPPATKKRKKIT